MTTFNGVKKQVTSATARNVVSQLLTPHPSSPEEWALNDERDDGNMIVFRA